MTYIPVYKSFLHHQQVFIENRNGRSWRYWMQEYSGNGYSISYDGWTTMSPHGN
jgi:hypothetical protein